MPALLATPGWRRSLAACALGAGTVTMTAAAASAAPGGPGATAPAGGSTAVFQTSQCTATAQTMGVDLTNLSAEAHTYTITTSTGPATPSGAQLASGGHTYLQVSVPRTTRAVFVYTSGRLVGSLALAGCSSSESATDAGQDSTDEPTSGSGVTGSSTATAPSTSTPTTTTPSSPAATALPTEDDTKDPGSDNLLKGFGIGVAALGIVLAGAVLFREFKK